MPIEGIPTSQDWIDDLRRRRTELTDPGDIAKVDTFIDHLTYEYIHDLDATMGTMVPDGVSRHWGGGPVLDGLDASVKSTGEMTNAERRPFYADLIAAGGHNSFKFVALQTDRFFVNDGGIATDGTLWSIVPGDQLEWWGAELPEGGDPAAVYAVGRRLALIMDYQDGKIVGEDTYWDRSCEVRLLTEPVEAPPVP